MIERGSQICGQAKTNSKFRRVASSTGTKSLNGTRQRKPCRSIFKLQQLAMDLYRPIENLMNIPQWAAMHSFDQWSMACSGKAFGGQARSVNSYHEEWQPPRTHSLQCS